MNQELETSRREHPMTVVFSVCSLPIYYRVYQVCHGELRMPIYIYIVLGVRMYSQYGYYALQWIYLGQVLKFYDVMAFLPPHSTRAPLRSQKWELFGLPKNSKILAKIVTG